jgi:hypothetical protein
MQLRKKYLVIFFVLICFGVLYFSLMYISNLPKKVSEYQGISLGSSKDEVWYSLGVPYEVLFPLEEMKEIKGFWQRFATKEEIKKAPNGEKGFNTWQYEKKGYRIDINFDPLTGKVNQIGCYVSHGEWTDVTACRVNGIGALDSEDRVIDILGKPSSSSISGLTKELLYPNLNMKIILKQKSVYYIIVSQNQSN